GDDVSVAVDREERVGTPVGRDGLVDRGERLLRVGSRLVGRLAVLGGVGPDQRLLQRGVDAARNQTVEATARVDLEGPFDRLAIGCQPLFERERRLAVVLADGNEEDVKRDGHGRAQDDVPDPGKNHHFDSPPAPPARANVLRSSPPGPTWTGSANLPTCLPSKKTFTV